MTKIAQIDQPRIEASLRDQESYYLTPHHPDRRSPDHIKNIGDTVRWLEKNKNPTRQKDMSRYFQFQGDHDQNTDECWTLRREVA